MDQVQLDSAIWITYKGRNTWGMTFGEKGNEKGKGGRNLMFAGVSFPGKCDTKAPADTKAALIRLMHAKPPPLPPAQLLLALHLLDLEAAGDEMPAVPRKLQAQACTACIAEKSVFTQEVMAAALGLLAAQEPLPLLSVRTIMQSLAVWPKSVAFVMDIIRRLLYKQVWRMPQLWQGVIKCLHQAMPESFPVLLQLPRAQLLDALEQQPDFHERLVTYAATNLDTVPQEALEVLGLDEEEELAVPAVA